MKHNEAWVEHALEQMTMPEKIGQMTQVSNDSITPAEVADHAIGSVLSGGNGNPSPNTPGVWADMVGSFTEGAAASRCGIPLIYGIDAVHGHSNVIGATVYPHNIGLGAVGDADLPPIGSRPRRSPEVGSEQLVRPIEQVQLHGSDPTAAARTVGCQ